MSTMMPDDAVLLCCTALASAGQQGHPYPVGTEWARLRAWYATASPTTSKQETEYWLLMLADVIRGSGLATETRVRCLQSINEAIYTVRDVGVVATRNDLWRWTQAVSWAKAAGIIHSELHTQQQHSTWGIGEGSRLLAAAAGHVRGGRGSDSQMFTLTSAGQYAFTRGEVSATRRLVSLRAPTLATIDAYEVFQEWIEVVSGELEVPAPTLTWNAEASDYGGGFYDPFTTEIVASVVSEDVVLHEYRHHLQYLGAVMPVADLEADARAWSRELLRRSDG